MKNQCSATHGYEYNDEIPNNFLRNSSPITSKKKVLKTLWEGYILKTLAKVIIGTGPHS